MYYDAGVGMRIDGSEGQFLVCPIQTFELKMIFFCFSNSKFWIGLAKHWPLDLFILIFILEVLDEKPMLDLKLNQVNMEAIDYGIMGYIRHA